MSPHLTRSGTVYLVGAGPGEPGLITVKGLRCLESADVVVYDRLVDRRLLAKAPRDAERIDVGKVRGERPDRQAGINALLVEKARDGSRVVRLKGGDPFVFGRGGEEAAALAEAGVPYEVVPGVTSAVAAPAYAGIPLTHRGYASTFTVITGSEAPDKTDSSIAWDKLAQLGGTIVVLMGWYSLEAIVNRLVREGRSADTPVALVQWGSESYQRTVVGTLSDIIYKAGDAGLTPPVAAVIGEVVSLRDKLRWFDSRPLFGKRVLVTRSRQQASALSELLSLEGAEPIELPTIEIRPLDDTLELDDAVRDISRYRWVVFTSANAVEAVFARLTVMGLDARALHASRVAAIGSATSASLRDRGIAADLVPEKSVSESVSIALGDRIEAGETVLLPHADIARDALREGLAQAGAQVHDVIAYKSVMPEDSRVRIAALLEEGVDVATFTSSSTASNLAKLLGGDVGRLGNTRIACIGPVTAATARRLGMNVHIVAERSTIAGLVDAIKSHYDEEVPQ
jgi:uroporphyrinogen III methyltransferase/synthase